MPELPEVENVRLSLLRRVVGRKIQRVTVARPDIVHGRATPAVLLVGRRITAIARHGKQLALLTEGPCVSVHLGMTGSLQYADGRTDGYADGRTDERIGERTGRSQALSPSPPRREGSRADRHIHLVWHLDDGGRLLFRDPRRFGGVWPFASEADLHARRWSALGEDALRITPARLHQRLQATQRALKAVLLDQAVVAGLGNIYVDELLHGCGLSPWRQAHTLDRADAVRLVRRMRSLLARAIAGGGSSLRDYVNGDGEKGGFQLLHRVYGRSGHPCRRHQCTGVVHTATLAGRTTAYCPRCQPGPGPVAGLVL